jgi:tetratricopeptide (TPR) repeat protein
MLQTLRSDEQLSRLIVQAGLQRLTSGRQLHPQTVFVLAILAQHCHDLSAAELFFRACLERRALLENGDRSVYRGLIEVLRQERKYEALAEVCRRGLKSAQPADRLLFHHYLSQALAFVGKMEEALAEADQAIQVATDEDTRRDTRLNRMRILTRAERYEDALREGNALLKDFTRPGDVREVRYHLSNVYSSMHDLPKAEAELQRILKDDADDATANNDLGYLWADHGKNLEEAERLIRKAIDLDARQRKNSIAGAAEGENAAYIDSLGWALFRRGQLAAARGWLEKAAALPGGLDDPVVWDHLGDVYEGLRDWAKARAAWTKSRELYESDQRRKPDEHFQEVKQKLQRLELKHP